MDVNGVIRLWIEHRLPKLCRSLDPVLVDLLVQENNIESKFTSNGFKLAQQRGIHSMGCIKTTLANISLLSLSICEDFNPSAYEE